MAYDCADGGDPRGAWCPACALPVREGEPQTLVHTPDGHSRPWHAECARPLWDKLTPLLQRLARGWSG